MIFLGILFGCMDYFSLSYISLGEVLLILFLIYKAVHNLKVDKNIFKVFLILLGIFIYSLIYYIFPIIDYTGIFKFAFKWFVITIEVLFIYVNLRNKELDIIKLLVSYYIVSSTIEALPILFNQNIQAFIHYKLYIVPLIFLYKYKNNANIYKYILYGVMLIHATIGYSRTALLLLALFIIYDFYIQIRDGKNKLKFILLMIATPIILVYSGNIIIENVEKETPSNNERTMLIMAAINEIKDNFITGVGPSNFSKYAIRELGYKVASESFPVHNLFLEIFCELGIIGILALIMIWIDIVKLILKKHANISTSFLGIYFLIFFLFNTYSGTNRFLFCLLMGTLYYYYRKEYLSKKGNKKE